MALTQLGIVYYAKDPHKRVFRIVYPERDDCELDWAPHDGHRQVMLNEHGEPHAWHTFGTKPQHQPTFEKILAGDLACYQQGGLANIEAELEAGT